VRPRLRPPWSTMIEEVKKTEKAGEVRSTTVVIVIVIIVIAGLRVYDNTLVLPCACIHVGHLCVIQCFKKWPIGQKRDKIASL